MFAEFLLGPEYSGWDKGVFLNFSSNLEHICEHDKSTLEDVY